MSSKQLRPRNSEDSRGKTPTRTFIDLLKEHARYLAVAILVSVAAAGLSLAQPLVINRLVDRIGKEPIAGAATILILLVILAAVLEGLRTFIMTRIGEAAVLGIRQQLICHLLRLPIPIHDRHRSGDLVTRLTSDTTLIRTAFTGGLVDTVGGVLMVIGAIVAMFILDPLMLGVILVVTVATILGILLASRKIQRLTIGAQNAVGQLGSNTERALSAMRTVRASRAEQQISEEISQDATEAYDKGVGIAKVQAVLMPISRLAMQVAFIVVLGIGGARVSTGSMSVADLVTFVLFLFMLTTPMGQVVSAIVTVRGALGAVERINLVLNEPPESQAGSDTSVSARRDAEPESSPAVELDDLSFSYNPDQPVLRNVSLSIPDNSMTAIVGPSGSGKSTLLALLERLYEPQDGRIRFYGRSADEMTRQEVRANLSYVEQNAPVLSGTVRQNLALGNHDVDDDACWAALRSVNMDARFSHAQGLDTVMGDRGINLSGGERQRLALARALLTTAPILLLDEPTASVDSQNEQIIQNTLRHMQADRTTVVVAHRLATVTQADQIIVLDKGQVAAAGPHAVLMDTNELYRSLAQQQLLT